MALDIRGSLKNTRINSNPYVVFDELLSNAIDAYLIRKNKESSIPGLEVSFSLEFFDRILDGGQLEYRITALDNGAGFADEEVKAFVTKDTSYKDDLAIEGIGKCRGSGRIQFLHYFSKVSIDSTYKVGDKVNQRTLEIDDKVVKEVNEQSFKEALASTKEIRTIFVLDVIKPEVFEKFGDRNLREDFSVESLKSYVMVSFIQRLVSLKDTIGKFRIQFYTTYAGSKEEASLTLEDLPTVTATEEITVFYKDANGKETAAAEKLSISHYKLSKSKYKLKHNFVALCAKSSAVKVITGKYLKTKALENNDIGGYYHIVLVESDYLDKYVNVQRDGFDIPKNSQSEDLFLKNLISLEQIYDAIDSSVRDMLAPPNWDKEQIVLNIEKKYGISPSMISAANVRIHYGHTEEQIVKRVLSSFQEQVIKDTSDIFDIKVAISNTDPASPEFRKKVNELAWKYTSSLKSMDMTNLSQLVVRRAAILEILNMAVSRNLAAQSNSDKKRYDEKMIHNIFFPMGRDSLEIAEHDIWLLSEEYHYFDYISSDKSLAKIKWDENSFLFESDIDDKIQELLKKNVEDNNAKRPDIAIFNKEGSLIIIEFKSPGVMLDEYIGDLMEYAQLLTAKSKGRIKKVYGYLLGTSINPNRITGYTRFPSGKGWFGTTNIIEHSTGTRLGELYSEILFYDDIVGKAEQRLEVYKTRLGIDLNSTPSSS